MENNIGVYKITVEDHFYIGSTCVDFLKRKDKHLRDLSRGKHINNIMQNLYNKYKYINFEIIENVQNKVDVITREQYYIDILNPDINICKIAGNTLGRAVTQETREKISKKLKGRPQPTELIEKLSKIRKGKCLSESHKYNLSKSCIEVKKKYRKSIIQFDTKNNFIRRWNSISEINRILGYHKDNIRKCCKGLLKTSKGFMWKYDNDISF